MVERSVPFFLSTVKGKLGPWISSAAEGSFAFAALRLRMTVGVPAERRSHGRQIAAARRRTPKA
jgi:hypothetical protein